MLILQDNPFRPMSPHGGGDAMEIQIYDRLCDTNTNKGPTIQMKLLCSFLYVMFCFYFYSHTPYFCFPEQHGPLPSGLHTIHGSRKPLALQVSGSEAIWTPIPPIPGRHACSSGHPAWPRYDTLRHMVLAQASSCSRRKS